MELRKVWFPMLVAAIWVVFSAITLSGFAAFSGAARAQQVRLEQPRSAGHSAEGRRGPSFRG